MARPPADPQPTKQRLKFNQPLKAGLANPELVKRLKQLHDQLRDLDQDQVHLDSLDQAAQQLIHPSLLLHKDKGVKAYVGCCLVDVLRLYAPNAPYTNAELKDLFDFLTRLFKYAGNPSDPHQSEYFYIIDSLGSIKSIVLVCDLDGAEDLAERVFRECFDAISSSSPKNVELAFSDILLSLLEELSTIPSGVTDVLTSQFLPKSVKARPAAFRLAVEVCKGASDKLQRYVSQYFGEIIVGTLEGRRGESDEEEEEESEEEEEEEEESDASGGKGKGKKRPRRKAAKAAAKKGKKDASTGNSGGDGQDLPLAFLRAHDLIRSLHRHVPALLVSVVPQLEAELVSSAAPAFRRLATSVLGGMFADGDLARVFPATWAEWGRRARDTAWVVRKACAERVGKVWREHPELAKDCEAILTTLLLDADERVRLFATLAFDLTVPPSSSSSAAEKEENKSRGLDFETLSHHVPRRMLERLADRLGDKKERVRTVAYRALGRLWELAQGEIESRDPHFLALFAWIPTTLLSTLSYTPVPASLHHVHSTLLSFILPLPSEKDAGEEETAQGWVDRFLLVERDLGTEQARAGLGSLTRLAEKGKGGVHEAFVHACESWNSGIIDDKAQAEPIKEFLKKTIRAIAATMPDQTKAAEDLMYFAKQNVGQLYRELRVLMDPQTDLKTYVKNERDLLRRLPKLQNAPSTLTSTFTALLRLSTPTLLGRSSIPPLLQRLQRRGPSLPESEAQAYADAAARTLQFVSRARAEVYRAHTGELGKVVLAAPGGEEWDAKKKLGQDEEGSEDEEEGEGKKEDPKQRAAEVALQALAKLKRADAGIVIESKLSKRLVELAKSPRVSEKAAKQAATIVALDKARPGAVDDVLASLIDALPAATDDEFVPYLAALGRIARYGHDSFETKSAEATVAALEVLNRDGGKSEVADPDLLFLEDAQLPDLTRARLLAIKVLVNRCLAFANTDSAAKVAKPVFQLLWGLLAQHGAAEGEEGEGRYSAPVASRLRLAAALSLLKLTASKDAGYVRTVVGQLDVLSRVIQDPTFEVREQFVKRLVFYLRTGRLHALVVPRFNMLLFLVAHEPEPELKETVVSHARKRKALPDAERQQQWELPFVRLIHLLAHHPDFEGDDHDVEEIKTVAKYFEFYFDIFATAENISYLFYLASRIKTVSDRQSPAYSANLYTLAEVAQHLLKALGKRHGWPISTYQGSVALPSDLFAPLPDAAAAKKVAAKTYVDEAVLAALDVKPEKKKTTTRKRVSTSTANGESKPKRAKTTPRGRPRKAANGSAKKKKGKGDEWDSDAEEEEDEESSEEEEEDEDEEDSDDEPKPKQRTMKVVKSAAAGKGRPKRGAKDDDDDAEEMDVDGDDAEAQSGSGDETAKGQRKAAARSPAKKAPATKKAAASSPTKAKSKAPAKGKASPAAKGKKAAAASTKAKEDAMPRRALRGLNQPRSLQKVDTEAVSDLSESGDEDEAMAGSGSE
ncbi:hypothetical protein JCM10207_001312 [Rhodosporidiobolus poonsookiae]